MVTLHPPPVTANVLPRCSSMAVDTAATTTGELVLLGVLWSSNISTSPIWAAAWLCVGTPGEPAH
jgi:hypothetical protein